jgi:hypothetical protein
MKVYTLNEISETPHTTITVEDHMFVVDGKFRTHCYSIALTKAQETGLPIVFKNKGAN